MPSKGIKTAYRTGTPLRRHHTAIKTASVVHFGSAVYSHENDIKHHLTKPNHPWTNDQVERMNRIIKEAAVKLYHYGSHDQLRQYLQLFVDAYNHARRLKTLQGLTPYEYIASIWTKGPQRFKFDPYRFSPGLNNQPSVLRRSLVSIRNSTIVISEPFKRVVRS